MITCDKCKTTLQDNDPIYWKCTECNKTFKVDFPKLQNIHRLKSKAENANKSLLKCPSCGKGLDNGDEKIFYKCSSCENIVKGNLDYFVAEDIENIPSDTAESVAPSSNSDENNSLNDVNTVGSILNFLGAAILIFGTMGSFAMSGGNGRHYEFTFSVFALCEFATILSGFMVIGMAQIIQLLHEIRNIKVTERNHKILDPHKSVLSSFFKDLY